MIVLVAMVNTHISAQKIYLRDWGIKPGSGENIGPLLRKIMDKYRNRSGIELIFEPGRYDFRPVLKENNEYNTNGLEIIGMRNFSVRGNGATFVYHGKMRPFLIKNSQGVNLEKFSIDWDRPLISQGEIVSITDDYLDLKIDTVQYPFTMDNGVLTFIGEGWKSQLSSAFHNLHTLYDRGRKEILYRTRDNPLGNIFFGKSEIKAPGIIRFYGHPAQQVPIGTYVTLYHGRYIMPGIEISHTKDTKIEDVTIYHALSHGILAERSENIALLRSSMTVNEQKGRVFSIVADASHFTNCKGKILVDGCNHSGMGDDFINVHGIYTRVLKRLNNKTIEVAASGRSSFRLGAIGDEFYFVDSLTMKRDAYARLLKIDTIRKTRTITSYLLSFNRNIPESIDKGHYLENRTWTASLELKNCKILKKHRARGILVTTPKNVVIEKNYFNTAGAAILIEGDLNFWFESGANRRVTIKDNIFENCLSSGPEWGEAVITITPSIKRLGSSPYHENIRIENNLFKHFDSAILFARSVKNLSFKNNQLYKTAGYLPFSKHPAFYFDGCEAISIRNNKRANTFTAADVTIQNMPEKTLKTDWR